MQNLRKIFNKYLATRGLHLFTCPCCWFPTLESRCSYDICFICDWEDDWQDDYNEFEILWWPNWKLSLHDAREVIQNKLDYSFLVEFLKNKDNQKLFIEKIIIILEIQNLLDKKYSFLNKRKLENLKNDFKNLLVWI